MPTHTPIALTAQPAAALPCMVITTKAKKPQLI